MSNKSRLPSQFPIDEINTLLPLLRGKVPDAGESLEAVWWIVGYGIRQLGPVSINALTIQPSLNLLSDGALATYLEDASPCDAAPGRPMRVLNASAIPWDLVVPTLLALLRRWAESRK